MLVGEEHLYCLMAMCQENSRNWLVKIESCYCEICINLKKIILRISLYNILTKLSTQVIRKMKNVGKGIISWPKTKFPELMS